MRVINLKVILPMLALAALVFGCGDPVVINEVLQQQEGQKIYTKYNIWFEDPTNISCLNIQKGSRIPVGTEIIPVKTTYNDYLVFQIAGHDEQMYWLNFDSGYRLCAMRDYVEMTFTTTPPDELLKDVNPAYKERILRGEVIPGMNRQEVMFAYGPPPTVRTPTLKNESWIYWIGEAKTIRVVFRADKVRNILNIND